MKIQNILAVMALVALPLTTRAQKVDDNFFFNHLSVGIGVGTNGSDIEVAMPISSHFTVRAGIDALALGRFNVKLASSMGELNDKLGLNDADFEPGIRNQKVNIGINAKVFSGHLLVDYYPWRTSGFHVTAGVYVGNNSVLHLFNTDDHSMAFLNRANEYVDDYNRTFGTNYNPVGLKFGDYIFTADEKGNMDAQMRVNPVRGYLGIGWGRSISVRDQRRLNLNLDFGFMHWGEPKMRLNGEKVIKTGDSSEGGVFKILSGFKAYPEIRLSVSYTIF